MAPKRLKLYEDWRRIFELRVKGTTMPDISEALGMPIDTVRDKIMQALHYFVEEPVEQARTMELARLDGLLEVSWEAARSGSVRAMDMVLKVMKQRADLMGLNAPVTHRIQPVIPDVEVEELRNRRWTELKDSPIGALLLGGADVAFSDPYEEVPEAADGQQGRGGVGEVAGADGGGQAVEAGSSPDGPDHEGDEAAVGHAEEPVDDTRAEVGGGGEAAKRSDAGKRFGKQVRFPVDAPERKTRLPARYFRGSMSKGKGPKEKE
jgi:hypothetical protein